jgi:hypothetical protein
MSEAAKKINIDVGDVLKKGSNEVGMAELNKMGLTKVKVIRHSQVQELISQAVENAISRFIFGAEGRKEHERLMSLINEKESALSDSSGGDRAELKSEVETLKRQMQDQAKRLEEAKAKVVEETKKEYEALAEKTSLENQLIMQKKAELVLHQQLQEMTMVMGQLKEKVREGESQQKQNFVKFQELEKLSILEEELKNLESDNESLGKELEEYKQKLENERQNAKLASSSVGEKQKLFDELRVKLSKLEEEKKKIENDQVALKEANREKEFALRELQNKLDHLSLEKEDVLKNAQTSRSGLDSELKKIVSEKDNAIQKSAQLETNLNSLKDQVREKDFALQKMQLNLDHFQATKDQSNHHALQLESQIASLKEANHEAKLLNEKLSLKEESTREKADELKISLATATVDKEKAEAALDEAENEIQSLQNTINELNESIAQKNSESQNVAMMEAFKLMMTDMKGDLSEQIGKIKMRSGGGGGGGGGNNNDSFVELDPAIILKNMFAEKVESNFGKVALDSRKAAGKKDFGKTLDALKNLKGDKKE